MMIRGLTSGMKSLDAAERKVLAAMGAHPIYDDFKQCFVDLRKGNLVGVVDFRALGRKRTDMESAIKKLHAKRFAAVTPDGRRSDGPHGAILLSEALAKNANERRGPRKKLRSEKRMPWDQVKVFWFDPLLDRDQMLEKVNGDKRYPVSIGYTTIWRELGERPKCFVGRPSKKD